MLSLGCAVEPGRPVLRRSRPETALFSQTSPLSSRGEHVVEKATGKAHVRQEPSGVVPESRPSSRRRLASPTPGSVFADSPFPGGGPTPPPIECPLVSSCAGKQVVLALLLFPLFYWCEGILVDDFFSCPLFLEPECRTIYRGENAQQVPPFDVAEGEVHIVGGKQYANSIYISALVFSPDDYSLELHVHHFIISSSFFQRV